eukprot:s619_g11.t1
MSLACYEIVSQRRVSCRIMTLPNGSSNAPVLHFDAAGVPRGGAAECACYQPPKPRPVTFERRLSNGVAEPLEPPAVCQRCGSLGAEHRKLQRWYDVATGWLERMGIQRRPTRGLPADAQHWEPQAAVLWAMAGGSFDLGLGARGALGNPAKQDDYNEDRFRGDPDLVSALCVTSQGRQAFHPLLYENFRRQSCETKELIIIDSGAEPSAFMLERKAEDARVFYYFFKAEPLSPGSPRLLEEGDAMFSSVLHADDPMECTEWTRKRPFATEVKKEGWTKGFKRNLACMMARGSTLVNLEDGCLYAEDYLDTMRQELLAVNHSLSEAAAVALQTWHTVALANQTFRWVDLGLRDPQLPEALPKADRWAHGFAHAYTRAAWLKQPFPDKEGPQDMRFMEALHSQRIKVALATSDVAKAACGWCLPQPAAKDAATSVNMYSELLLLAGRGQPVDAGAAAWSALLPMVEAAVEEDSNPKLVEETDEKGPDFSKIMDAARQAVQSGMTRVTSQILGAGGTCVVELMKEIVGQMNDFATDAEVSFNETMDEYKKLASQAETVSQNLTKFKSLVQDTIAGYVPFYSGAVDQVNAAVKTAQLVVKTMGKKELEEKLQDVNETVTTKLNTLAKTSSQFSSQVAEATLEEYKKIWSGLKDRLLADKLAYLSETTGNFREAFNEKLKTFTGILEAPLKIALGEEATTQINDLTSSTEKMLANLQHLTNVYRAGYAGYGGAAGDSESVG